MIPPTVAIPSTIANLSPVILKMFDMPGREVAVLVDEVLAPGEYRARFEGKGLPTGVNFSGSRGGIFNRRGSWCW